MTAPLPLLSEDEVRSVTGDDDRRSFGSLSCEQGVLPLKALHVGARIVGTFAHTTLRQSFVNNAGVPVEATYIFPLPDRAAATRFVMEVAGRRVEGDLQERHEARQTYDRAISQGKRASIAEEERPGTFSLRVGNLMPGEEAVITLEMTGPLPVVDGEVTYRFPLVVAPRYMPGRALPGDQVGDGSAGDTDAVPDASRISPPVLLGGYPNPVRLSIEVTLDPAGLPLSKVRSALHTAWADESQGLLRVKVGAGERLNRDFILRFCLGDAQLRTTARATKLNDGRDDAFLLTVVPPRLEGSGATQATRSRDIVFVLDRSGSMGGWKMIAARRAVARMVDSLRASDRFSVLAFDDHVDAFQNGLSEGTDRNRYRCVEWLAKVDARGGTEMAQPLSDAADLLGNDAGLERERVLVFVTDGQVGNESQLVKLLANRLKGSRVFALGIDQAVNAGFLNRLAQLGGQGEAELVESEDRVDEVLARCHRRIDTPVLGEISVDVVEGGSLVSQTLSPARLPDVFNGVPAVVLGRLKRSGSGKPVLMVRGKLSNGQAYAERIVLETTANGALVPAWGRLHLRDLEDQFDGGKGNKGQLEQRIVQVSLEAKVLCRFTAFVAVDHEVVNEGGRLHKTTQAVEAPAGWKGDVDGMSPSPPPPPRARSMSTKTGGMSVPMASSASSAPSAPAPASRPARVAARAPREEEMEATRSVPPSAQAFDDDDDVAGSMAVPQAISAPADLVEEPMVPVERKQKKPGGVLGAIGGVIERAKAVVYDKEGSAKKEYTPVDPSVSPPKAQPRPAGQTPTTTATTTLQAYADQLRALIVRLQKGEAAADVADDLRLLIEEAAHAGVPPAARKPLDEALQALGRNDVDAAVRALEPHAAAAARAGFWR